MFNARVTWTHNTWPTGHIAKVIEMEYNPSTKRWQARNRIFLPRVWRQRPIYALHRDGTIITVNPCGEMPLGNQELYAKLGDVDWPALAIEWFFRIRAYYAENRSTESRRKYRSPWGISLASDESRTVRQTGRPRLGRTLSIGYSPAR